MVQELLLVVVSDGVAGFPTNAVEHYQVRLLGVLHVCDKFSVLSTEIVVETNFEGIFCLLFSHTFQSHEH